MKYRKQTQHIRRYRSGRLTLVNRGVRYKMKEFKFNLTPRQIQEIQNGEEVGLVIHPKGKFDYDKATKVKLVKANRFEYPKKDWSDMGF